MSDYLPDPIERGEARAEAAYDELYQGNGMMKCPCGNIFKEGEGHFLYPDPYAPEFCDECAEKAFPSEKGETPA